MQAFWDVPVYAEHQEAKVNRVGVRIINHKTKNVITLEMSCSWIGNMEKKILTYGPLGWELKQRYPGNKVQQYNIIMDVLGGWSKDLNGTVRSLVGGRALEVLRRMQKALLSATPNIARTFKVVKV